MIWWIAQNTVSAAALALVAVVVCRVWRTKPALRHALWLVVLLKLIAPPLPVWSFAWTGQAPDWWPMSNQTEKLAASSPAAVQQSDEAVSPSLTEPPSTLPGDPEEFEVLDNAALPKSATLIAVTSSPATQRELPSFTLPAWSEVEGYAVYAWLACAMVMAVYQLARWRRFRQLLDHTEFAPDWLLDEVHATARELSIAAPPVVVLGLRCTPLVWVLGRVRLVWPESMLAGFPRESRKTIITHELAHLARRDHWVARLETAAAVFWWWNPLFWYVRAKLHDAAEQACDARVTQLLPDARRAYAEALVEVCEILAQAVTPGPALGIGSQTRRAFERRLTMILRDKVAPRLSVSAVAGVGLLALAVLPGFTPAQYTAPGAGGPPPATPAALTPALPPATGATLAAPPAPVAEAAPALPPVPGLSAPLALPTPEAPTPPMLDPTAPTAPTAFAAPGGYPGMAPLPAMAAPTSDEGNPEEVVHLTRATYRLPRPMAESFSQFLNSTLSDAVQAQVQDAYLPAGKARMEGGGTGPGAMGMPGGGGLPPAIDGSAARLVVTADADTQRVVGHFVALLRKHGKLQGDAGMGAGMMGAMTGMSMDASYQLPGTTPPNDPNVFAPPQTEGSFSPGQ